MVGYLTGAAARGRPNAGACGLPIVGAIGRPIGACALPVGAWGL